MWVKKGLKNQNKKKTRENLSETIGHKGGFLSRKGGKKSQF